MRFSFPIILCFFLFNSCSYNSKPQVVTVGNEFTMTIPSFLKEDKEIKPGAPFQYANRFRNIYSTVFYDEKSKVNQPKEAYYKAQTQIIKNILEKPAVTDSAEVIVNGLKAIHTEIFGKMQGENIYYSHLLFETPEKYYQVCVWTRGEDRKLKYAKDIDALLYSFRLLK